MVIVWSFIMPFFLAALCAVMLASRLFAGSSAKRAILRAREVIMTEQELEQAQENKAARYVMDCLLRAQDFFDIESLVLADIRNMLTLMGIKRRAERELAGYIVYGAAGAIPVVFVPFLTGYWEYVLLYPLVAAVIVGQRYGSLKNMFKKWQIEITRDLPELIDKLRISFASGRDYISAFAQVRNNSGPQMKSMIDKLINDLQSMRPIEALDNFSDAFKMPAVTKFTSAVKVAIEYGYEAAESYFQTIENDIIEVKRVAIEELTKTKPEKVYQLYLIMLALALGSLAVKGWEIFSQVGRLIY